MLCLLFKVKLAPVAINTARQDVNDRDQDVEREADLCAVKISDIQWYEGNEHAQQVDERSQQVSPHATTDQPWI